MSEKILLQNVVSLQNQTSAKTVINSNFQSIAEKIDTLVSRDGDYPNQMEANLDMNSHRIVNLPEPSNDSEPARLKDIRDIVSTGIGSNTVDGAVIINGSISHLKLANGAIETKLGYVPTFSSTRQGLLTKNVPSNVNSILATGYYTEGDFGGNAIYFRLSSTPLPSKPWHVQSADGAWWQLTTRGVHPYLFGAKGDFSQDDYPAWQATFDYAANFSSQFFGAPGNYALYSTPVAKPGPTPDPEYTDYERGPTWRFDNNCRLRAQSSSMEAVVQFGDHTYENIIQNGLVEGGKFDQNNLALRGVWVTFFNDCNVTDTQVYNVPIYGSGIQFGTTVGNEFYATRTGNGSTTVFTTGVYYVAQDFVSVTVNGVPTSITWVDTSNPDKSLHTFSFASAPTNGANIRVYFAATGYAGFAFNNRIIGTSVSPLATARAGTIGIKYVNCSDNQTRENAISGVLFGISADFYSGWDGKHIGNHFWNWSPNGPMTVGFDLYGDNYFSGNQHDGPFLYVARFRGSRNHITGTKVNYGSQDADVDGVAALFRLETDATYGTSGGVTVTNSGFKATVSKRIVAEASIEAGISSSAYRKDTTNYYLNVLNLAPINVGVGASGVVTISGGTASVVSGSQNIASVTRSATGVVSITFSTPVDVSMPIVLQPFVNPSFNNVNAQEVYSSRTTTSALFYFYNTISALTDPGGFSVVVGAGGSVS